MCFPIPTVAAIARRRRHLRAQLTAQNGHAFAGGIVLALAHDYRVLKDGQGRAGAMVRVIGYERADLADVLERGRLWRADPRCTPCASPLC